MARWWADTIARHVEANGEIIGLPWEDEQEQAVYVASIGSYSRLWQSESEAPRAAPVVVEPRYGAIQAAVINYLREYGEAQSTDIASAIPLGNIQAIRSRLCAMEREGKLCKTGRGRYRLS